MSSWATASVITNQLIPCSAAITESSINTKCRANFIRVCISPSSVRFCLSVAEDGYKVRRLRITGATKSSRESSNSQTQRGTWEEPDDGSGSEYDDEEEDEEMEDENFGFESDWEEEETSTSAINDVDITSGDKYVEDIKKEVEQLLEPEERAVLQQNVTPNLEKISTAKWSPLHTLALSTQISCMDKLLENGLDIDFLNKEGLTALHKAIIGKKEAVISHLLRKGASPHVKDK